jgi:predicted negative regulator of RcsB-dependent stress response
MNVSSEYIKSYMRLKEACASLEKAKRLVDTKKINHAIEDLKAARTDIMRMEIALKKTDGLAP